MIVELTRGDFIRGIKTAMSCVSKKSSTPIFKTVYIEGAEGNSVSFSGNSTDIGVVMHIHGNVLEPGSICADGETISKIANLLPNSKNPVLLKADDGVLSIICGKVKQTIPVFKGEDFIKVDNAKDEADGIALETDEAVFTDCLKVIRPFLNEAPTGQVIMRSMLLKASGSKLSYTTVESARLCYIESEALPTGTNIEAQAVIPSEHVSDIIRMLDGKIGSDFRIVIFPNASKLVFKKQTADESVYIRVSLFAEKYGEYTNLIPKAFEHSFRFDKEELKGAITRASNFIVSGKNKNAVVLTINENGTANIGIDSSVGNYSEDISMRFENSVPCSMKIGMNPKFMIDMLNVFLSDSIILNINGHKTPMTSFADMSTAKIAFLIMPVNI